AAQRKLAKQHVGARAALGGCLFLGQQGVGQLQRLVVAPEVCAGVGVVQQELRAQGGVGELQRDAPLLELFVFEVRLVVQSAKRDARFQLAGGEVTGGQQRLFGADQVLLPAMELRGQQVGAVVPAVVLQRVAHSGLRA